MIVAPRNADEWGLMARFVYEHAHVQPQPNLRLIGYLDESGKLQCVVAFTSFLGSTAQIHVAYMPDWHFTPRALLRAVFRYAYIDCKLQLLLAVANSQNEKAMTFDQHIGFRELYRLRGLHDDGGDIVLMGMRPDECRYLDLENGGSHHASHDSISGAIAGHA